MAADRRAFVPDSFAVLAYLEGEASQRQIQALLKEAGRGTAVLYLSLIDLGEVLYIVEREQGLVAAQRALAALDQLPIQWVPVTWISVALSIRGCCGVPLAITGGAVPLH